MNTDVFNSSDIGVVRRCYASHVLVKILQTLIFIHFNIEISTEQSNDAALYSLSA